LKSAVGGNCDKYRRAQRPPARRTLLQKAGAAIFFWPASCPLFWPIPPRLPALATEWMRRRVSSNIDIIERHAG